MENIEVKLAEDYINYTNKNIFITGKAGTGKTTFLKHIVKNSPKNLVVTAPTGVAAINAGGVTLHSFFQLPFECFIPTKDYIDRNIAVNQYELIKNLRFNGDKKVLLRELETLIIDEISMVRSDTLDAIDTILRNVRSTPKPFGGVQVVMFGDMFQLPPIIKDNERHILSQYYKSPYFFDSKVMQTSPPVCIEFKKIYRQSDESFISILNNIRNHSIDKHNLELLNSRYQSQILDKTGYITLTTHNRKASAINDQELDRLTTPKHTYTANIDGKFYENAYPVEATIELKVGAQVMFIKNDSREVKEFYNGKIGKVISLDKDKIIVGCENNDIITVPLESWENIEYVTDEEGKAKENVLGTYKQYPLRLAWAVTVHKSQGLTFDKVVVDVGEAFASGQVYVALSRCTSLEGIILDSVINENNIINNPQIVEFQKKMWDKDSLESVLEKEKYHFGIENLLDLLNLEILREELMELQSFAMEKEALQEIKYYEFFKGLASQINTLNEVQHKFQSQLLNLFNQYLNNEIKWDIIHERAERSTHYFYTQIQETLKKPLIEHQKETVKIKGLKTYQQHLNKFLKLIDRKLNKLEQNYLVDKKLLADEVKNKYEKTSQILSNKPVGSTFHITQEMIQEGKSIEEVAEERNMAVSTIEGHCAKLIKDKMLDIHKLIDKDTIDIIKKKAEELNEFSATSPIFGAFDGVYSYSQIRMVLNSID